MSYAAFKMMHRPTGIEHCAAGFVTLSRSEASAAAQHLIPLLQPDDIDSDWPAAKRAQRSSVGPLPNLVVAAANVLEIYLVRAQEEDAGSRNYRPSFSSSAGAGAGGLMDGVSGARLELVCSYR